MDRPTDLIDYRGLVFKTASLIVASVEDDFDDIVQVLWIKVWRARESYDPARSRMPERRYVFMCLTNQVKDIMSKRRRGELSLEVIAVDSGFESRDRFDAQYLSVDHQVVYGEVEDPVPLLPNTLTELEREIVALLTQDYRQTEAARLLGIEKRDMERSMRAIRSKMADWRPTTAEPEPAPLSLVA